MLWLLIMITSAHMIFYWTSVFIVRHIERPMYMAIERDNMNWETFFPAFTICAQDKVNETALQEFIRSVC